MQKCMGREPGKEIKGGAKMATHVMLVNYTQKNIKQGSARLDGAKKTFKAMGAQMKEFTW
jgi:uncharacterized protein with GYD domain